MAETKVILCDSCKKIVAIRKCDVCNKDLCSGCTINTSFKLPANLIPDNILITNYSFIDFNTCKTCETIMKEIPNGEINDLRNILLKKFQARLMLKTIEGDGKTVK